MHFKATSPAEAADILQHCITNDGIGIFNRQRPDGAINPISVRMNKRVRLEPDFKERLIMAFNIRYQTLEEDGHLWISDPETSKYYWLGDERIEDKPPMTFAAPSIHDLVGILRKEDDCWQNVNFLLPSARRPQLRVVGGTSL